MYDQFYCMAVLIESDPEAADYYYLHCDVFSLLYLIDEVCFHRLAIIGLTHLSHVLVTSINSHALKIICI